MDADGDLQQVQSRKANETFKNYANSFNYTAAGAVSSMRLGNGRWETTSFNSRLQPVQIGLGSSATDTGLLKLNYDYGTTDNNGNVKSQQITVPTVGANAGFTAVQTYTYDSLNRLQSATEVIGSQTWKQTFLYDRYGNRNFDGANTTTLGSCPTNQCNPTVSATNNRFTSGQGYTYDLAGNIITDAEGRTFTYDGENKQKEVKDVNNISVGQYFYDGDGKRVKKFIYNTQETTLFVYDASGKMVAEYSTTIAPASEAKVSYLTNDHLGSPRITTDANGQVISRRDFLPFGEEIFTAQRTQGLGYTADTIRQKFTSYERDIETDLDFAQARYFNSSFGRFSTPDDFFNDTDLTDPRSWNLYVYVRNNPLKYIDPTGEEIWISFTETVTETDAEGNEVQKQISRRVQYKNGGLLNEDGTNYSGDNQYALDALNYLNTLSQDPVLNSVINHMVKSSRIHTVMSDPDRPDRDEVVDTSNGRNKSDTIYWSGIATEIKVGADGSLPEKAIHSLAHELAHAWYLDIGKLRSGSFEADVVLKNGKVYSYVSISYAEIDAVNLENRSRILAGDDVRRHISGADISDFLEPFPSSPNRKPPTLKPSPRNKKRP